MENTTEETVETPEPDIHVLVFKTAVGDDVVAEVIEQWDTYYVVRFPLEILDPVESPVQYISKWMKYNEPFDDVVMYKHALAAVTKPSELTRKQYYELSSGFRKHMELRNNLQEAAENEDATDESKAETLKNILQFIKRPEGSSTH